MPRSTNKKSAGRKAPSSAVAGKKQQSKGIVKKGAKKVVKEKVLHKKRPIFEPRPRNFGIGNDIQPKRDLSRFVRWPKYIRLQRQRQVLMKRLKVPPAVNQFRRTLSSADARTLFQLLQKYRPETKDQAKKRRLEKAVEGAEAKPDPKTIPAKSVYIHHGLNHVTNLVEKKKAKLVIIAHDVDPIELVLWLPTLCKKKEVPYVIVKGKSRLGRVVNRKTTAVVAITSVDSKDQQTLATFVTKALDQFNSQYSTTMRTHGGLEMGPKHRAKYATPQGKH